MKRVSDWSWKILLAVLLIAPYFKYQSIEKYSNGVTDTLTLNGMNVMGIFWLLMIFFGFVVTRQFRLYAERITRTPIHFGYDWLFWLALAMLAVSCYSWTTEFSDMQKEGDVLVITTVIRSYGIHDAGVYFMTVCGFTLLMRICRIFHVLLGWQERQDDGLE